MKKIYCKNVLVPVLLTASLAFISGCQNGNQPVSTVSDAPPTGDTNDENQVIASMGTVNLGKKQVISYLQSQDQQVVSGALNQDGGFEAFVKGIALRANVISRAAAQNWQKRDGIKTKIEAAQKNVLYSMYINDKSEPQADFPDTAAVTNVYIANQQQRTDAGLPELKPLWEIEPVIRKQLREKKKQLNQQNYLNGLVSSNPASFDLGKLLEYLNLPQAQQQQQGEQLSQQTVARMGNTEVSLGQAMKSLSSLKPSKQRQILSSTPQLQQYVKRLATRYLVLNEAIAAGFDARPVVKNRMQQAGLQVVYTTYMNAWSAPESDFPNAALVEDNYRKNVDQLVVPERYHLAKIILANSGDSEADATLARNLADRARASGTDFAALARQYSQNSRSARNGGDIGWINARALSPEVNKMITGNQPGTVIGPLPFQQGFQLIKILGHQPARGQTLEEARPALVAALRKQRRAEKEKQILEQLVASEPVTIDKTALQQLRQELGG